MNNSLFAERLLTELGFPKPRNVQGRGSIADIYRKHRCGIYVLHFANDEYYVGQAGNVVRRYAQHRHTHSDIRQISFKQTSRKNLDSQERQIVKKLEDKGLRLRNIQLVSFSYGETDFDLIMPPSDQTYWLNDPKFNDLAGQRPIDDKLRNRYQRKFVDFQSMPFAADIIKVFQSYVQTTIPAAKRGEISFWMCSCILKQQAEALLYSRINIGFQTALEAYTYDNRLFFGWFITRSLASPAIQYLDQPIKRFIAQSSDYLLRGKPVLRIGNAGLVQGGQDQIYIEAEGVDGALNLLRNPDMILGFRKFNLGLVQKGPCPWGRFHCLDFADKLLEPIPPKP